MAGPPNGFDTEVSLLPTTSDTTHVATVSLTPTTEAGSPLFDAITERHTSRGAYDTTKAVDRLRLDALGDLADSPEVDLVWFTTEAEKQAFSDLTVRATEAIIADKQQAADDYRWYRSDWDDIQQHKDGITIDPSGQSELIRAVSKLIPTSREQNNDGWLAGWHPRHPAADRCGVRRPGGFRLHRCHAAPECRADLAADASGRHGHEAGDATAMPDP